MSRIADIVLAADDITTEDVPIERWGVTVTMKGMNGTDRSTYLQKLILAQQEEDMETLALLDAELVVKCTYDPEDGSKVFTEDMIPALMQKAGDIIGVLSLKAQRLSGLDGKAEERLGKGSSTSVPTDAPAVDSIPSDASSSPSPEN